MRYFHASSLRRIAFLGLSFCAAHVFGAGDSAPPYVGEVSGNRVNIRAGGSINYRILKVANMGDKVIVRELKNGWARVDVPHGLNLFITQKFVRQEDNGEGVVIGDSVNVRPTPSLREPPVCQLKKDDRVRIVDRSGTFFKIEPPAEAYAWMSARYVRYFGALSKVKEAVAVKAETDKKLSEVLKQEKETWAQPASKRDLVKLMAVYTDFINDNTVQEKAKQLVMARRADLEKLNELQRMKSQNQRLADRVDDSQSIIEQLKKKAELLEAQFIKITTPPPAPPTYTGKGTIKRLERLWNRPGTHQLVNGEGKAVFLLKSDAHNLDEFSGRLVGINGETKDIKHWRLKLLFVDEIDLLEQPESK